MKDITEEIHFVITRASIEQLKAGKEVLIKEVAWQKFDELWNKIKDDPYWNQVYGTFVVYTKR